MSEKVPLWVLAQSFTAHGDRGTKFPPVLDKDACNCEGCETFLPTFRERNWWHEDKKHYCDECIKPLREADRKKFDGRGGYSSMWRGYSDDYMGPELDSETQGALAAEKLN